MSIRKFKPKPDLEYDGIQFLGTAESAQHVGSVFSIAGLRFIPDHGTLNTGILAFPSDDDGLEFVAKRGDFVLRAGDTYSVRSPYPFLEEHVELPKLAPAMPA